MKFSTLSTVITFLVYSNVSYAQTCAEHISASQRCVAVCVNTTATENVSNNGNLLIQCINKEAAGGLTYDGSALETCCEMNAPCKNSMENAGSCLTTLLPTVKSTSQTYLNCIYQASRINGDCTFAGVCVNVFTGGFGLSSSNNFDVGATGALAALTRQANSCDDMTSLYVNACDTAGCCPKCRADIADVVSAVTNEILFPAYNPSVTETCGKSCADVAPAARKLEGESSTTATTTSAEDNAEVVDLATECHDGLKQDIVVYNQTYAVDKFFECLGKKVGQIVANADTDAMIPTQGTEEESSSSSSSSSISSSMMLVVSAIASAIINY